MEPCEVLELGDPRLREPALPVEDPREPTFARSAARLQSTLSAFRRAHGFGRAIAAPQIGLMRRCVALDLGDGPELAINPEITWRSTETFTMWDDCMSFPSLLVRVRRHDSISVEFTDAGGQRRTWSELDRATSELMQHEIDHLDGVLAIDRAEGPDALITRRSFAANRELLLGQVDEPFGR